MAHVPQQPAPRNRWKQLLRTVLGIGLGGFFLYVTMSDVSLRDVWASLGNARLSWLPLLGLLLVLDYWLRSMRWRRMFPPQAMPSRREAFDAFMMGALGNNLLPGRIGDLLRAAVIGRHLPALGATGALGSILLEKILDGLVLLVLLGLALVLAPLPDWITRASPWALTGVCGVLAVLFALSQAHNSERLLANADRGTLTATVVGLVRRLSVGLHGLRNARRFFTLLGVSLPIWVVETGLLLACFLTFDLVLPLEAALVTVILLSVGTMLPAAPGFVGTYQFFIVTALSLYGVGQPDALALSIFLNLCVIALTTLIGVAAIMLEGGLIDALRYGRAQTTQGRKVI